MRKLAVIMRGVALMACLAGAGALAVAQSDDPFASDGKGNNFSDSDIDNLFGTFEEQPAKKVEEAPKRVLPPFTGTYKVLIGRPIYAVYEAETKTKWISALGEIYAHYKIASFPRTHAFTMEQISGVLPSSRDYGRRFNKQHYIEAARKLGATHLLYQEYQPQKDGKRTRYVMELYWIGEGATVEKASVDLIHSEFEGGLNVCLAKIADAMDPGAKGSAAYGVPVWGKDLKTLEPFGNALAGEGKFSKDNAAAALAAADRYLKKNDALVGFQYAAALLAGRAEQYGKAVQYMEKVISKSKDYPALQLRLAEYLRGAERYSEAMRAAETASRNPALKIPAAMETAMIYQAQGNIERARSEYDALVQGGDADGRLFFRLALLSIEAGRVDESEGYLNRATETGFALDENEYFDIGRAYANAGNGYEEKAIEFLKRSMGVKQSNEDAWEVIADVYNRMGDNQLEAESYVNLFKINMQANSAKLKTAGEIYEKLGMTDKAKDAYALFVDRRFYDRDVSMSLARIYFNEKNCKKLPDVLKGLDTIPEAVQMLSECGYKVRTIDASQTMRTQKLSPLMFTLRISGAVLAAGGLAGGLIIDGVVIKDLDEKYHDFGRPDKPNSTPGNPAEGESFSNVKKLREDIDSSMMTRNLLYVLAGVGLSGFAVTFFF